MKKRPWYLGFIDWPLYRKLYAGLLIVLTIYIVCNWEKCIAMQFFSQFDGNNILFLVWILLIVLPFYDIEIKEAKLHIRNMEKAKEQVKEESVALTLEQRKEQINNMLSEMVTEMNGGDKNNELYRLYELHELFELSKQAIYA